MHVHSLVCIHAARHESDLCLTGSNSEFYSLHTGEFRVVKKIHTDASAQVFFGKFVITIAW